MGQLVPDHEIRNWGYGKLSKCKRARNLYSEVKELMEKSPDSRKIVSIRMRIPAGRLREAIRAAEALGETLGQCLSRTARISLLPPALRERESKKRARDCLASPASKRRASKLVRSEILMGQKSRTKARIASAPYGEKIQICLWVRVCDCIVLEKAKDGLTLTALASILYSDWLKWLALILDEPMADTLGGDFWPKPITPYLRL